VADIEPAALLSRLNQNPRASLAQLPTPIHRLPNFQKRLSGADFKCPELWIKRDDLTGLEGGGNKTRKLEFLVGDAIESGADTLVTAGAIQSNHTRQTAAAAAKCGLQCALLHFGWTKDAGSLYRQTGNLLLSSLMGAELYLDETVRPIEDQSPLSAFAESLKASGRKPYLIPAGGSEHRLGSFGYMLCATEIAQQCKQQNVHFDYIVHCSGSSSTQAGLLAGFAFMGETVRVIGVADDHETDIKQERVLTLANDTLREIDAPVEITAGDVEVISADQSEYGLADEETYALIRSFAETEGLIADPVYEGKALRGLRQLIGNGRFDSGSKVLLMHLGGTPAVHAYANQFPPPELRPAPIS